MLDWNKVRRACGKGNPENGARGCGVLRAIACGMILLSAALAGMGQDAKSPSSNEDTGKVAQPTPRNQSHDKNAMRRKELADESDQLYALAVALKLEVDKTNKDVLSLAVIRKADAIEKLAHSVKNEMKRTSGGN
jgi:hypothetical protein